MLTLINTNRMQPPIAPLGLDYLAGALQQAGRQVELLDLALAEDPEAEIARYFATRQPRLVGLTLRNVDDCFWPSGASCLPAFHQLLSVVRRHTAAPLVVGGVGYSIFPGQVLWSTGADFGIHGDGELALAALLQELEGGGRWERVPGLWRRAGDGLRANPPHWPARPSWPWRRQFVDNRRYFQQGGQLGVETKRGCARRCSYCADPLAKGASHRLRDPAEAALEVQALAEQGLDVLHLCDPEFNLPLDHAGQVCQELIRRSLGQRVRWYAYLSVLPLPEELVRQMRRAGCVGINFTSDSAEPQMLAAYGHAHRLPDLRRAVEVCRRHGIAVMFDMLLGGPGETPETAAATIRAFQQLDPDCAGAAVGVRLYPGTAAARWAEAEGGWDENPNVRRRYDGPVDLLRPTFYLSAALGPHPAHLVRELIGGDPRFFPPGDDRCDDAASARSDHNYSDHRELAQAIAAGARGAYWDILRQLA